jgi:uncharacterized membrane protein HdeD (DUF308 family)
VALVRREVVPQAVGTPTAASSDRDEATPACRRDDQPMTDAAVSPSLAGDAQALTLAFRFQRLWWLWLVTGIVWLLAALVILQFDSASVTTVGVIVGCMFVVTGAQNVLMGAVAERHRWLFVAIGAVFVLFGMACFFAPQKTFAGVADMLAFLLMVVGIWWAGEALFVRHGQPLWWLGLLAGVLTILLAFWMAGQFFVEKGYLLLVIAGFWALLEGITDIVRAFQIRCLR